jgi:hypothetical protein
MLRLLCAVLLAAALVVIPSGIAPQFADQARAEATKKAEDGKETKKKKTKKAKKKRELTKEQKAARERQKKCGAEWREAKKAGKIEKGMTWPKYWSRCNTRLKAQKS